MSAEWETSQGLVRQALQMDGTWGETEGGRQGDAFAGRIWRLYQNWRWWVRARS